MDLCQFFTASDCSRAVVAELDSHAPAQLLDVAAGHGSLIDAASRRWAAAQLATMEYDHRAIDVLRSRHPSAEHIQADLLSSGLPNGLERWIARADVVLCNPPFRQVPVELTEQWLKAAGMPTSWSGHIRRRAEIIFLAHNLRMLRPNGELAMILPAAFISGEHFRPFRSWMLDTLTVTKVVQLSRQAFLGGNARGFAVIAQRRLPRPGHRIELIALDLTGNTANRHSIGKVAAVDRLDHEYYQLKENSGTRACLSDVGVTIERGKPVALLKRHGVKYFHTTDFARCGEPQYLQLPDIALNHKLPMAVAGDILIGRVGRQCFAQAASVVEGSVHFSDCILRIRTSSKNQTAVFNSMIDPRGQRWRQSRLHGSAAQFISRRDIFQHPIWSEPVK